MNKTRQRPLYFEVKMGCECAILGRMAPCSWCTDPDRVFDSFRVDVAYGATLDKIGEECGIVRGVHNPMGFPETDASFRDRILERLRDSSKKSASYSYTENKKHDCECGAHKLGFNERGAGHSSWCPMYK